MGTTQECYGLFWITTGGNTLKHQLYDHLPLISQIIQEEQDMPGTVEEVRPIHKPHYFIDFLTMMRQWGQWIMSRRPAEGNGW